MKYLVKGNKVIKLNFSTLISVKTKPKFQNSILKLLVKKGSHLKCDG